MRKAEYFAKGVLFRICKALDTTTASTTATCLGVGLDTAPADRRHSFVAMTTPTNVTACFCCIALCCAHARRLPGGNSAELRTARQLRF